MVCHRCKLTVKEVLEKHGLKPLQISLGEITLAEPPSPEAFRKVSLALQDVGFELMNDQKSQLIEKIKTFVINSVHYGDKPAVLKYSVLIAQHVNHDYSYISKLFSEVESITLEQFIIQQRIEKAKELMTYGEMSLSQIALELGYSSTAHLSAQFKKVTGTTPSVFKKGHGQVRRSLDELGRH